MLKPCKYKNVKKKFKNLCKDGVSQLKQQQSFEETLDGAMQRASLQAESC